MELFVGRRCRGALSGAPQRKLLNSVAQGRKNTVQIATMATAASAKLTIKRTKTLGPGSACRASVDVSITERCRVLCMILPPLRNKIGFAVIVPSEERRRRLTHSALRRVCDAVRQIIRHHRTSMPKTRTKARGGVD
jgi:hypothetical protein